MKHFIINLIMLVEARQSIKHGFLYWPLTSASEFAVELFHVVHETP